MPTLKAIHTFPYDHALTSALAWGKDHKLAALNHVLVVAERSDGALGIAEATPRPSIYGETPASVVAILRDEVAPLALGQPVNTPAELAALDHKLALIKNNNTAKGALNMALWAAMAQVQGAGLAGVLGAAQPATTLSFILGTGSSALDEARAVYAAGVRCLKIKVGKDFAAEAALIQTLRAELPDLALYADANECYTPDHAAQRLAALRDLGLAYCEEPLPVQLLAARAALRGAGLLPIIADDSCFTVRDVERELAFDTFDIVNIKTARTGFSQSISIQEMVAGKGVMVGSQASTLLGALHAILFACRPGIAHPTEGTFFLKVVGQETALPIHNGRVRLVDAQAALDALQAELLRRCGF